MKELSASEMEFIAGAGDDWNPTSFAVGVASTVLKVPTPVNLALSAATEIAVQAAPHLPVNNPVPVLVNPSFSGAPSWAGMVDFCLSKGLSADCNGKF